jgi:small conductance mechanosensitive channel
MISEYAAPSVSDLTDAIASSQVTGWDLLAAVVIVVLAYPVGILVRKATIKGLKRVPDLPAELAGVGGRIAQWLIYLLAVGWALSLLGLGVGWVAVLVLVVLVTGFLMLRPMIENSAAGLLLTLRPAYSAGDRIETLDYEGSVTSIGTRSTVLKATDGREIHIPNTEVLKNPIVVYTARSNRKASFDIPVSFATDLDALTKGVLAALSGVEGLQSDPAPTVQASGIRDGAITLSISYWYPSSMASGSDVTDGAIRAVRRALADAGIEPAPPAVAVDQEPDNASDGAGKKGAQTGQPSGQ